MQEDLLQEIEELIPVLRRYARFLTCAPQSADDLVQDCLERAVCRLDEVSAARNLRSWLVAIMCGCFSDERQREKRRVGGGSVDSPCEKPRSHGGQEHHQVEQGLAEAFLGLPGPQKLAMICVVFERLPYDEAADVLELPPDTIRARVNRGRKALRQVVATEPLWRSA